MKTNTSIWGTTGQRVPGVALSLASVLVLVGCGGDDGSGSPSPAASSCGPYPEQATSLYVLPYEVGTGHEMVHGNCAASGTSHQAGGTRQYAYDFEMPIGTVVVAARAGEVSAMQQSNEDGTRIPGEENFVMITHDEDLFAFGQRERHLRTFPLRRLYPAGFPQNALN